MGKAANIIITIESGQLCPRTALTLIRPSEQNNHRRTGALQSSLRLTSRPTGQEAAIMVVVVVLSRR